MAKKINSNQILAPVKHVIGAVGEPAYQNGWQAYNSPWGVGANYFIKGTDGMVTVSMMCKLGTNNSTIFQLPVGFRPLTQLSTVGVCAVNINVLVDITTDGAVRTENATSNSWVAFNFTFLAEA